MPLLKLGLVLGGAASGKSSYAEGIVTSTGRSRAYLATAEPRDGEMAARIERHRTARGEGWRTVEAPLDAAAALATIPPGDAVLIDCATLWLSNQMLAGRDLEAETDLLLAALAGREVPVVMVSNELGLGLVPETPLGRAFRDAQGRLNERLAEAADLVVLVVAGLPLVLKGCP